MIDSIISRARTHGTKALAAALLALAGATPALAWEPTKPVEFVIPAAPAAAPTRWRACCRASSSSTS